MHSTITPTPLLPSAHSMPNSVCARFMLAGGDDRQLGTVGHVKWWFAEHVVAIIAFSVPC